MPLTHVERAAKGSAIIKSPLKYRQGLCGDERFKSLKDPVASVGVVVMLVGDMVIGNREPTRGR